MKTIPKKEIIVCDLDGTLAASKMPLGPRMSQAIRSILAVQKFAVVSGGSFPQFEKQFLPFLQATDAELAHLYLFPTNGSTAYTYTNGAWQKEYEHVLTEEEKKCIITSLEGAVARSGVDVGESFGERIEDRGTQVTFSALGQAAPIEKKAVWDPNQAKRRKIADIFLAERSEFSVTIGGMTSIDITRKGVDKAYAIEQIERLIGLSKNDIVFLGDALYPHGNDEPATHTGVVCISVSGPEECAALFEDYITRL